MIAGTETTHDPDSTSWKLEFRKLWAASAISNLGDGVVLLAAPLLAAALTRDPVLVAGLAFVQRVPWLLFLLLSGALADRIDRQRAMFMVAMLRATMIGMIGLAALLEMTSIWLLYVVFFVISTGETLFDTASASVLPAIVPRDELTRANARLDGTWTVANSFIGPPLGGLLFTVAVALPFLFGAAGLAASAVLILSLRGNFRAERPVGATTSIRAEIREGMHWLWRHRLLRTMALSLTVLNIAVIAQVSIMVLFAREQLGLGPRGFGLLLTAHATGAVVGSVAAHRVIARFGMSKVLRTGLFIEAGVPAVIALAGGPLLAGTALAVFGFHAMVWGALLTTVRQEITPDRLRGRVESVYRLLEHGAAAPGAILGGVLAATLGLAAPFWIGAIAAAAIIPFVWSSYSEDAVNVARRAMDAEAG